MKSFKDLSINTKLTLLVMVAGGTALLLSSIVFVGAHMREDRAELIEDLTTLAQFVGSTSTAALTFDDAQAETELLAALHLQPIVESALLYDQRGRLFASYVKPGSTAKLPAAPPPLGVEFIGGYLEVVQEVTHQGEQLGTVFLRGSTSTLRDEVLAHLKTAGAVIVISLLASLLLSYRLQRVISIPILRLADTAQQIAEHEDYSLRVEKTGNDELGTLYDSFNGLIQRVEVGKLALEDAHRELEARVENRTRQLSQTNLELSREIAERRRAEQELADAQQQLIDSARRAGMAEIATGVLHNVGNVLNSVNVSATLVVDRMQQSKVDQLTRATNLIEQHRADLGTFITEDPKGKQIPDFLKLLAAHLADERTDIMGELTALTSKIDHIKTIVATQQSYAGVSGVIETMDVSMALEDALQLNSASLERHGIHLVRDYATLPKVLLDKQRLIQILVNLVKNAKDALLGEDREKRQIKLRTRVDDDRLTIEVTDNGMGIPPEHITRIFSHGFTTKKQGHGFGLHSCANAAREMGGRLTAHSDGPGRGATFTLELPVQFAGAVETSV